MYTGRSGYWFCQGFFSYIKGVQSGLAVTHYFKKYVIIWGPWLQKPSPASLIELGECNTREFHVLSYDWGWNILLFHSPNLLHSPYPNSLHMITKHKSWTWTKCNPLLKSFQYEIFCLEKPVIKVDLIRKGVFVIISLNNFILERQEFCKET